MQLLLICWPFCSHSCVLHVCICVCARVCLRTRAHICVTESPSLLKMLFRNDIFPHDSVAFSGTANQGSGAGMSCRDAARRQAATTVCRLISAPYCHFVKSHYPNENGSGKAVTEQGYGWDVCQRHSDFILSALFLNSESWAGGWGEEEQDVARRLLAHSTVWCVTVKVVLVVLFVFSLVMYLDTYLCRRAKIGGMNVSFIWRAGFLSNLAMVVIM